MSTFAFGTSQGAQLPGDTLGPAIQAGLGEITLDDITTAAVSYTHLTLPTSDLV